MPFALRWVENRVNRALCCALSCCVYVWGRIRFPSPTPGSQSVRLCSTPLVWMALAATFSDASRKSFRTVSQ
jgi:hypothetical protein